MFIVLLSGVNGKKELLRSKVSGARYGELMLTQFSHGRGMGHCIMPA